MPAETARLQRRLGARDWWMIIAVLTVTAVLTAGAVAFSSDDHAPGASSGCISITRAWIMGAATSTHCGTAAARLCSRAPAGDRELAAKCDALGLKHPES